MAFTFDRARLEKMMTYMARAIYFDEFHSKWNEELQVFLVSASYPPSEPDHAKKNAQLAQFKDIQFQGAKVGDNPEIFYYQLLADDADRTTRLRMVFYQGFVVWVVPLRLLTKLVEQDH